MFSCFLYFRASVEAHIENVKINIAQQFYIYTRSADVDVQQIK